MFKRNDDYCSVFKTIGLHDRSHDRTTFEAFRVPYLEECPTVESPDFSNYRLSLSGSPGPMVSIFKD